VALGGWWSVTSCRGLLGCRRSVSIQWCFSGDGGFMGAADLISGGGGAMRPRLCTTVLFPV